MPGATDDPGIVAEHHRLGLQPAGVSSAGAAPARGRRYERIAEELAGVRTRSRDSPTQPTSPRRCDVYSRVLVLAPEGGTAVVAFAADDLTTRPPAS